MFEGVRPFALARDGVAAADVRVVDMYVSTARADGRLAHSAGRELYITMRDVARAQQIVADIARAGGFATRIMQFSYGVEDPAVHVPQARAARSPTPGCPPSAGRRRSGSGSARSGRWWKLTDGQ